MARDTANFHRGNPSSLDCFRYSKSSSSDIALSSPSMIRFRVEAITGYNMGSFTASLDWIWVVVWDLTPSTTISSFITCNVYLNFFINPITSIGFAGEQYNKAFSTRDGTSAGRYTQKDIKADKFPMGLGGTSNKGLHAMQVAILILETLEGVFIGGSLIGRDQQQGGLDGHSEEEINSKVDYPLVPAISALGMQCEGEAAVFDMEYMRWLEDQQRLFTEVSVATQEHLAENELRMSVDRFVDDEMEKVKLFTRESTVPFRENASFHLRQDTGGREHFGVPATSQRPRGEPPSSQKAQSPTATLTTAVHASAPRLLTCEAERASPSFSSRKSKPLSDEPPKHQLRFGDPPLQRSHRYGGERAVPPDDNHIANSSW
ncbi:hypothetical protein Bca101_082537 [Brassica carinata]